MSYYKTALKGATKNEIRKFFSLRGINTRYSGRDKKFYFDKPIMPKILYKKGKRIKIMVNHLASCQSINRLINLKDVNFGKPNKRGV